MFTPSRSVLDNAASAVDSYTESLRAAQEAAQAGQTVFQLEQNNYSPTALSASEIYRQTKNIVAAAELKMVAPS